MLHLQLKSVFFASLLVMQIGAFSSVIKNSRIFKGTLSNFRISFLHLNATGNNENSDGRNSVTGNVYTIESGGEKKNYPMVQLYTKDGCTLCDKVSDVLKLLREDHPHSLDAVDITDDDKKDIFDKYKWDIPVLHINGKYWTKHKLDEQEARVALSAAENGEFEERRGEPNASAIERRMAERCASKSQGSLE